MPSACWSTRAHIASRREGTASAQALQYSVPPKTTITLLCHILLQKALFTFTSKTASILHFLSPEYAPRTLLYKRSKIAASSLLSMGGWVTKRKRKVCVWDKLKERSCKHCCDGEGNYKCAHCLAKTKKGMEEYIYIVAATGRVQPRFIVCVQHVKGMQPPNHAWPSYASRSFQAK